MATQLCHPYYITERTSEYHVDLCGDWQLQPRNEPADRPGEQIAVWSYTARVPQTIHWSLHAAGVLPHPYYNRNIKDYAWVETKTWYYRRTFATPPAAAGAYAFLCFDGVDHACRVWLNGDLLGSHEGMFGGPMIEVSEHLRAGQDNEIIVEVQAASFGQSAGWNCRQRKGHVIKPWGISRSWSAEDFMSVGMWRPVRLEIVPHTHMERPFLKTLQATDERAVLELNTEVNCNTHSGESELNRWDDSIVRDMRDRFHSRPWPQDMTLQIEIADRDGQQGVTDLVVPLSLYEGRNWVTQRIELPKPKLWWPVGLGVPHLYHITVRLLAGGREVDTLTFDYGIRTIETRPTAGPQTTDRWADWRFAVNGQAFFVKGINWMPADQLLDLPASRYRWLLEMARAAGIQMIRIWGAGLIETDDFYRFCDELGIMVWQDLPIANSDSPEWPLDIWQAMVVMNVFRLRNHPSLAVWCGGNEFNPYSFGNTAVIGVVERSVQLFDGTRIFRRTSPDEGSIHTYPDMDPTWYQHLYPLVPFIAETGIHSFPEARLLRELCNEDEFAEPLSGIFEASFGDQHPDLRQHFVEYIPQRVPRMLARSSHITDVSAPSLESLTEASQISAGEFYQVLSDVTQANYPVTGGLLPWVFKRPWPNIGVQLVDGMGHAGAPYYFLKRTYEQMHVMVQLPHMIWGAGEEMPVHARVLNLARGDAMRASVSVIVLDAAFHCVWQRSAQTTIPAAPAVADLPLGSFSIPSTFTESFFFIVAELHNEEEALVSRSVYWPRCLSRMDDIAFRQSYRAEPQPALTLTEGPWLKPQVARQGTSLELKSVRHKHIGEQRSQITCVLKNGGSVPAFPVQVDVSEGRRIFYASDNYFWLAPGEERAITIDITWRENVRPQHITVSAAAWNAAEVQYITA